MRLRTINLTVPNIMTNACVGVSLFFVSDVFAFHSASSHQVSDWVYQRSNPQGQPIEVVHLSSPQEGEVSGGSDRKSKREIEKESAEQAERGDQATDHSIDRILMPGTEAQGLLYCCTNHPDSHCASNRKLRELAQEYGCEGFEVVSPYAGSED